MKKTKFRPKRKKLVLLLVVISIVSLITNSYSKEKKHGAQLLIQKKDGQIIKAELLAVKDNKLILMDSVSLSGITIDINETKSIRIMKKSKIFQGIGYGLLTGGGSGALIGLLSGNDSPGLFSMTAGQKALLLGLGLGILGAPIGGIWGAVAGIDESVVLEGKSPKEMKPILKKLNSKSRFPKDLPDDFKMQSLKVQKFPPRIAEKEVPIKNQIKIGKKHAQKTVSNKLSRNHITLEPGYFYPRGPDDLKEIYKSWGFGDNATFNVMGFFTSWTETIPYPSGESKKLFFLKNIKIEYSINKKFALGFMFSPLGKYKVQGYDHIKKYYLSDFPGWHPSPWESGILLTGEFNGNAYYLTAAYMPVPDAFLRKSSFKLGTGIGLSMINLNFRASEKTSFSKSSLCFITFAEYDYYFNRQWSIGVNIDYKYVPFKIGTFQSIGYYDDADNQNNKVVRSLIIDFPEQRVNFGGFGFGINLGVHF